MYKEFQKELYNRDVMEFPNGFIVYSAYEDKSAYIHSVYVKADKRSKGRATSYINHLVKKLELNYLTSYVDLTSKNKDDALAFQLAYGAKIVGSDGTYITLYQEIK